MIFAQIKNGKVVNVIKLDDNLDPTPWTKEVDSIVKIGNLEIIPQIGWAYDGENFSPPEEVTEKEKPVLITGEDSDDEKLSSPDLAIEFKGKVLGLSQLSKEQRDALKPVPGMMIFNSDSKRLEYFNGESWVEN